MALPPEAAEALDDTTSPERLTEIAEQFPELQGLVASNPSCTVRTRAWILGSNPSAAELYRATHGPSGASDAGAGSTAAPAPAAQPTRPTGSEPQRTSTHAATHAASPAPYDDLDDGDGPSTAAMPSLDDEGARTAAMPPLGGAGQETEVLPTGGAAAGRTTQMPAATDHGARPVSRDEQATEMLPVDTGDVRDAGTRAALPRVTGYLDAIPRDEEQGHDAWQPQQSSGTYAPPQHAASAYSAPASPPPAHHATVSPLSPAYGQGTPSAAGAGSSAASPAGGVPLRRSSEGMHSAEPARNRGRAGLWAIGCLAFAAVLAVVAAVSLFVYNDRTDRSAKPSAASSAAAASSEGGSASASASGSLVKAAPSDAQDLSTVQSPSKNISCALEDSSVSCTVNQRTYSGKEDCPAGGAFTIAVADKAAGLDCDHPLTGGGTALDYGSSAKHGQTACTSEKDGMTCWNQRTGHGFTVNRSSYTTF